MPDRTDRRALWELSCDGVLSRAMLRAHGWDRDAVARQVAADRWATHGRQTVALHTAPLGLHARWWRAIWEVGHGIAALDGVTALHAGGLRGYADDQVHVSVEHTARVRSHDGVRLHKVIRRVPGELSLAGIPRTRPAIAAVRAAHWAVSNRQAALLVLPVPQRLTTASEVLDVVLRAPGRNRRAFIRAVAHDIADGAQSLGELDFAALCRARGLPEPTRQQVRRGPRGTVYLDVRWDAAALVVEIDGSQHAWGHGPGLRCLPGRVEVNSPVISGEFTSTPGWGIS